MNEMLKLMKQALMDSNNHLNQRIDYVVMDMRDTKENIRGLQETYLQGNNKMGLPSFGGQADYLKKCRRAMVRFLAFMVMAFIGGICAHLVLVSLGIDEKLKQEEIHSHTYGHQSPPLPNYEEVSNNTPLQNYNNSIPKTGTTQILKNEII